MTTYKYLVEWTESYSYEIESDKELEDDEAHAQAINESTNANSFDGTDDYQCTLLNEDEIDAELDAEADKNLTESFGVEK